ncbi:MAG: hypothetical protein IPK13_22565 [Deltaproteobacteria bacterium]|nr:hypothetical protein [Deltaproteobacteria bacterium]
MNPSILFGSVCLLAVMTTWGCGGGTSSGTVRPDGGGAGGDGAGGGDGGGGFADGDVEEGSGTPPRFSFLSARVVGRRGLDLRLQIEAEDDEMDISSVSLRAYGPGGSSVLLRDSDLDGELDAPDRAYPFPAVFDGNVVNDVLTIPSFLAKAPNTISVDIVLLDRAGNPSEMRRAEVVPQPVRNLAEACDPTWQIDRCKTGLACRGEPAACVEGVPPVISRVSYLRDPEGPKVLVIGTDIDQDVNALNIGFLDKSGQPKFMQLASDFELPAPPLVSGFRVEEPDSSTGNNFFLQLQAGVGFEEDVVQVSVRAEDEGGRLSDPKVAAISSTPMRGAGAGCDPRGFDRCTAGLVCSPGIPGISNTCQYAGRLRTMACNAAPTLDPMNGAREVIGETGTSSLWDAPAGCGPRDPIDRVESAVMLHLATGVSKIVLSTEHPETNFDTMVYVIPGCATTPTPALGCADDLENTVSSRLELTNLAAGDYLVVVDAWGVTGGSFRLSATVEP